MRPAAASHVGTVPTGQRIGIMDGAHLGFTGPVQPIPMPDSDSAAQLTSSRSANGLHKFGETVQNPPRSSSRIRRARTQPTHPRRRRLFRSTDVNADGLADLFTLVELSPSATAWSQSKVSSDATTGRTPETRL
jgi:hypothetical protein